MNSKRSKEKKSSAMTRHQKVLIGIAVAFLLYSVVGFMVLPGVLQNTLEKKLTENLKRPVSIEAVQVNPYLFRITVNNLLIRNLAGDDHFVAFDRLFIDLEIVSVFKRALVVRALTLTGPRINIVRNRDNSYNFSDLVAEPEKEEEAESVPFHFSINNIEIINGTFVFQDKPKDTVHRVVSLNLAVPFVSSITHEVDINVEPAFSAIANDTPVNLGGRTIPFHETRKTVFDIEITDLNIPQYLAYFPDLGSLTLESGILDINAVLGFEMEPGNKPAVTLEGGFTLRELNIAENDGESYVEIPKLETTMLESKPLEQDIHLAGITINEPSFLLKRTENGEILPLALLPGKAEDTGPVSAQENEIKLVVDEITLNSGTVQFDDRANEEPFQTTLNPVEIKIEQLSTLEDAEAVLEAIMQTGAGEIITANGTLTLAPVAAQIVANIEGLILPRFSPYYSEIITVQVMDGSLDLEGTLHYSQRKDTASIRTDNVSVEVSSLLVNDKDDEKLFSVPAFSLSSSSVDLTEKQVIIGELASNDGELHLVRNEEGLVILNELLKQKENPEEAPPADEDETAPWMVTLQNGVIDSFSIILEDHVPAEPATLVVDNLKLNAANISTVKNTSGEIDLGLRIDKKGTLSVRGPVTLEPLSTSLIMRLADLQVKTVQPYFADKANLVISDGAVNLEGKLDLSKKNKELATFFTGKASIDRFASFDPIAEEEFLKWQGLELKGMEYDSSSFAFRTKEILWQDFYSKVVRFENGMMNLNAILKSTEEPGADTPEKEKPEEGESGKSMLIEIDTVKLEKGRFDFLDRNIKPNYTSRFSELSGTITGLSSKQDIMAEVNVSGKLDGHAPLLVTGAVNPLRGDLFIDLGVDFKDIELSPTSPYTGKYIGYKVAKGKLSLDLNYQVEARKIVGKNKAFLDQFTLGETVDSPDALKLPINLALSLLRNRAGEITLNVPVKGDLDDPKFSIGGIIFKAIVNLIAKAATSPFALLGALIPEGAGDLQHVDFAAGSAEISEENTKGLETIAKVLYDRPGLKMDIKGNSSPEQERSVMHENAFQQLLKNEKYKKVSKRKDETLSLDDVTIEPDEYEAYLKKAYKEAEFEKPKNAIGLTKRLPPEEMEKLLRENIVITDDDLRLLAIERANNVKSFLVEQGQIEPERLFIIEPQAGTEETGALRVDMVIK